MEDHESLRALFKDWPQVPSMALFKSIDGGQQYYCLYCEGLAYEIQEYSIYEIPELLKLVGKRMQLFTSSLQKELSESQSNLPIILDWQGLERDILILNVNNTEINLEDFQQKIALISQDIIAWSYRQVMAKKETSLR